MIELPGLTREETRAWCKEHGMPAFRGDQVYMAVIQGMDFQEMTTIPQALRLSLQENLAIPEVRRHRHHSNSVHFMHLPPVSRRGTYAL